LLDLSDPAIRFQDAAGTTPAVSDGDPLGLGVNTGSGTDWTQVTADSRPTYHTSGGPHWIDLDGTDDWLDNALSSLSWFAMAVRLVTGSEDLDTWLSADADDALIRKTQGALSWDLNASSNSFVGATIFVNGIETNVFALDADHVVRVIDAPIPRNTGVIGRADDGAITTTGRYATGRLYALVGGTGTLTAAQAASLDTWLGVKAGLVL
jgi:hypothetical protein